MFSGNFVACFSFKIKEFQTIPTQKHKKNVMSAAERWRHLFLSTYPPTPSWRHHHFCWSTPLPLSDDVICERFLRMIKDCWVCVCVYKEYSRIPPHPPHTHTQAHTSTRIHAYTYSHTHTHTRTHTCTNIHKHTHVHTYTTTNKLLNKFV